MTFRTGVLQPYMVRAVYASAGPLQQE